MPKLDPFTRKRLRHFADTFRQEHGQLPTLRDFEENAIPKETVTLAVKEKILVELYVTMTTGAVVKGYKSASDDPIV